MKMRRSGRLVDMTSYLLDHPHLLVSLSYFSERYGSAKSSISEDLGIIKSTFEQQGIGSLLTISGASGGVKFIPMVRSEWAKTAIAELCEKIAIPERILPGGYLYLSDILGDPRLVKKIGQLYASIFANRNIDVVVTVATKGIPIAHAVAAYLNVPVVIVRRDTKVTEGSTVSINYVTGRAKKIQSMVLAKRSLTIGANVLIVDDFMMAGGTVKGMISLLEEFQAKVAGIGVLVEAEDVEERLVDEYISLVKITKVDEKDKTIAVQEGNYFQFIDETNKEHGGM